MKPASMSLTLVSPLSLRRQMASSSLLSSSAKSHVCGGERYREQLRQKLRAVCLGISSVMSTVLRRQLTQSPAVLGSIAVPRPTSANIFVVSEI